MVALIALAGLQYYWVDQVSAGERERRQDNLSLAAERIGEDFDRELARAYLALQMDAATLRDRDWDRYARRLDRWSETAPYPGLVKHVYLVQVNQIGHIGATRYSPATRSFESVIWPFELMPVRRDIERAFRAIWSQGDSSLINLPPASRAGPSLLIPIARPWLLSGQGEPAIGADLIFSDLMLPGALARCLRCPPELYDTPLLAHTLVVLDRDYIARTLLPALIERYFPDSPDLEYHVGVVDQADAEELIFSSDPSLPAASFARGDASASIFGITYDELNALLLTSDPRLDGSSPGAGGRLVIGVLGRQGAAGADEGGPGQWTLVLKHRQGSLDTAVAALRTRNLLLSFGTVLLLGVSIALLLATTRRAQRLAQQQLDFASAVSHELRTPLAVIRSAGENLADGLVLEPEKARQYGAVISNEGRRLTDMVEQVLAFAGAQSGQERYHLQRTEVAGLVESAIQAMQPQIRAGGHSVDCVVAPELPPVSVDPAAIRRSLQNLIGNAMKYGGPDGWVGVEARLQPADGAAELALSVRDNGPGVDPAELPHLFEPFFRGRAACAAQAHGSGLGLSLVRHAVEAHGGRVGVESRPGHGACFTIFLPVRLPAAERPIPDSPAAAT
jgi:signal transduction histidine kinase